MPRKTGGGTADAHTASGPSIEAVLADIGVDEADQIENVALDAILAEVEADEVALEAENKVNAHNPTPSSKHHRVANTGTPSHSPATNTSVASKRNTLKGAAGNGYSDQPPTAKQEAALLQEILQETDDDPLFTGDEELDIEELLSSLDDPEEGGHGPAPPAPHEIAAIEREAGEASTADPASATDASAAPAAAAAAAATTTTTTAAAATSSAPVDKTYRRAPRSGGLARAEAIERRLAKVGNRKMIAPLRIRRPQAGILTPQSGRGVLRLEILKGISSQLSQEAMKADAGLPTCVIIQHKFIAIGTSHGMVLVFDHYHQLKVILGSSTHFQHGSVACIDMSADSEWLVCGHTKGAVVIWDILHGNPIKTVTDAHSGSPIVHLRFAQTRTEILSVDAKGKVKRLSLSRMLMFNYMVSAEKLLDGEAGQIYALAVLQPAPVAHPTDTDQLFAMCTAHKTSIVRLHPHVVIAFKISRPASVREGALPYLTWRRPTVQGRNRQSAGKVLDPVLAVAWGRVIQLIQVVKSSDRTGKESHLEFISVGQFETDVEVTGLEWMGEEALVFINAKDQLRVFDPFSLEELETIDISRVGLVYHTNFSNVYGTQENAYHSAFRGHDRVVYLLGLEQIQTARILSWSDRISALVEANEWIEALSLALEFYEGRAKAVAGLPRDVVSLRKITGNRIAELLLQYINYALPEASSEDEAQATQTTEFYQHLGGICIDYCQSIKRIDLLFNDIYSRFKTAGKSGLFLELLEPYILNDKLTSLNPAVMQAFVDHYAEFRMLRRVEQCILHMDIASLDFHQIATLCREHRLFSALIYIFNKGIDDYIAPVEDLMAFVSNPPKTPEPAAQGQEQSKEWQDYRGIGYKLLLYLNYCFSGKAFPTGRISSARLPSLRADLLNYFFDRQKPDDARQRLHALLMFDARELFAVLGLAVLTPTVQEDTPGEVVASLALHTPQVPDGSDGEFMSNKKSRAEPAEAPDTAFIVKTLLQMMVDTSVDPWVAPVSPEPKRQYTKEQYSFLFRFISIQLAAGRLSPNADNVARVLTYLTGVRGPNDDKHEAEDILLKILAKVPPDLYDQARVLHLSERAEFYKVCALAYQTQKKYAQVLDCYLKDEHRKHLAFDYIQDLTKDPACPLEVRESIKAATLNHLPELIELDNKATARLIIDTFAQEHERVLRQLDAYPKFQFQYLKGIMMPDNRRLEVTMGELLERSGVSITADLHELYVKLLCQFDPDSVYSYLNTHDNYRLDFCLQLCQQYNVTDATAYLLERTGDVQGALVLLLQAVDERYQQLVSACEADREVLAASEPTDELMPEQGLMEGVLQILNMSIALCQRNSQRLEDAESEMLWFKLLDKFVVPQRGLKKSHGGLQLAGGVKLSNALASFVQTILYNMTGSVALPTIVSKIVHDHGDEEFGEFKSTIMGVLETYSYERTLLKTANHLIADDMFRSARTLSQRQKHALTPKDHLCGTCGRSLREDGATPLSLDSTAPRRRSRFPVLAVFNCTHAFHRDCLTRDSCPICAPEETRKRTGKGKGKDKNPARESTTDDGAGDDAGPDHQVVSDRTPMSEYMRRLKRLHSGPSLGSRYDVYRSVEVGAGLIHNTARSHAMRLAPPDEERTRVGHREPGMTPAEPKFSNILR